MSKDDSIHRMNIDRAVEKKENHDKSLQQYIRELFGTEPVPYMTALPIE